MPCNFLLKTGHLNIVMWYIWKSDIMPLHNVYSYCLLRAVAVCLMIFPNYFCWLYSLWCVVTAVSVSLSHWSATDWTQTSLATWNNINKTKRNLSWSFQIGSELVTPVALSQTTYTLAFTSCLYGAQRSAKDASLGSSQVQPWAHVLQPGFLVYEVALQSPYSPRYLPPLPPPSQASWTVCCLPHLSFLAPDSCICTVCL